MLHDVLLTLHIGAGFTALLSAPIAVTAKIVTSIDHRWHVRAGRLFAVAMIIATLCSLPLALLTQNLFLGLVGLFSCYLVTTGWRHATLRQKTYRAIDRIAVYTMVVVAALMLGYGVKLLVDGRGPVMLVFAGIAVALATGDVRRLRKPVEQGAERIANHLTMMLAASIAALTAFLVTNISINPPWIIWLAPSVVITPLIVRLNAKVRRTTDPTPP